MLTKGSYKKDKSDGKLPAKDTSYFSILCGYGSLVSCKIMSQYFYTTPLPNLSVNRGMLCLRPH